MLDNIPRHYRAMVEKLDYAFQPIVHAHSGKIYAVEALIRNVIDNNGLKSIDGLFNLAYNEDFLYQLDLYLREKAIKKFSRIEVENLKLFYNLDNRIIYSPHLSSNNTETILGKYNLDKENIYFELSEKGEHIEQGVLSSMLQRYKNSGYSIAIDDFGTGVSGLKLLYFSEAEIIKLDRYFITNIDKYPKKKLFCSSIIDMAHIMGMKVVAEGVETKKEFYVCKDIGADFIQGYLIQKPTKQTDEILPLYHNVVKFLASDKRQNEQGIISDKYVESIMPLKVTTSLYNLFVHFKENTNNNFVPIVDEDNNFIGIIDEADIKKISYSKYGIELAKNKTYFSSLKKYVKDALCVEITWGIDKVLEMYNLNANNSNGIFITESGKYKGFINLNSLLTLSYNRNIEIATNQNPLTKLPGNNQIEKFIAKSVKNFEKNITHIIYFDFNDFKPFNDAYGFRQGDRAILIFSELIQKRYPKNAFVAHVGGDDFFVGLKNHDFQKVYDITCNIQDEFSNSCKNIYSKKDKDNGFIIAKDRFNIERKFELLSVASAIIEITKYSKVENFDLVIGELKKISKKSKVPICTAI